MTTALLVDRLSFNYGSTRVLFEISLEVKRGEVLALLGPSGSGKSTLLHLIGGLDLPSGGEVIWGQQKLSSLSSEQRAKLRNQYLGLIFQHHYLLEDLSALENVTLPLVIRGANDPARAKALLERVGLGHRTDHLPKALSGGERQRVALARALILRPPLILADEPTGSLDQANSKQVMDLLLELAQFEGAGVVMVTHDERLAQGAHRILHLVDGKLLDEHTEQARGMEVLP